MYGIWAGQGRGSPESLHKTPSGNYIPVILCDNGTTLDPRVSVPAAPGARWREVPMAGNNSKPPQVPKKGGGTQERDRNKDGAWREKRSDAGTKKK